MTLLQRLWAVVAGLLCAGFGLSLLGAAAGWLPSEWLLRPIEWLVSAWRLELWALGFVSFGVGLAALLSATSRERRDGPVVTETELGTVAISRRAVEKLVERAARRTQGVRDVKVALAQDEKGLAVSLTLDVTPDVSLPTVSHEVQAGVETYLKETSGLNARRVNVEIRQVAQEESRKEVTRS